MSRSIMFENRIISFSFHGRLNDPTNNSRREGEEGGGGGQQCLSFTFPSSSLLLPTISYIFSPSIIITILHYVFSPVFKAETAKSPILKRAGFGDAFCSWTDKRRVFTREFFRPREGEEKEKRRRGGGVEKKWEKERRADWSDFYGILLERTDVILIPSYCRVSSRFLPELTLSSSGANNIILMSYWWNYKVRLIQKFDKLETNAIIESQLTIVEPWLTFRMLCACGGMMYEYSRAMNDPHSIILL